jgi:hypothetical protein
VSSRLRAPLSRDPGPLLSRRAFLGACASASLGRILDGPLIPIPQRAALQWGRESGLGAFLRAGTRLPKALPRGPCPHGALASRFADLRRHFVFEYYPWYGTCPFRHWDQWDRVPPEDIAARYYPFLGPYESRSRAVLEQHARWIAESGAGAINLSWWGPESFEEQAADAVMDVMRDHDLKVAFHLEPHSPQHGRTFMRDVLYLLRRFGEKRHFDAFLILRDADGREGPVFKGFRMILPEQTPDRHGALRPTWDFTSDDEYRRQTDVLRRVLAEDFDHVTLLADSLNFTRTRASGFDGIAVYDNFIAPEAYADFARSSALEGLLFSFNVNPGYDAIEPRISEPEEDYAPHPFAPGWLPIDFSRSEDRERAAALARQRITQSFQQTLAAQSDSSFTNFKRGFLLVYVTSFNEWHEGHAFEPMKDAEDLTAAERAVGYHNPLRGDSRLACLTSLLRSVLSPDEKGKDQG